MANKKRKKKIVKMEEKQPKNKFLTIFVCIFLGIVAVFSIILGVVSSITAKDVVVEFRGTAMDKETASFFVTQYKYNYMGALSSSGISGVKDDSEFWNTAAEDGKTYGEHLAEGAREYIRQIIVTNYLYDRYTTLSSSDRDKIMQAVEDTVTYKADGNGNTFNEAVKKHGFSYKSFRSAATMIYKANVAQSIICGSDGSALADDAELISEYLSEYSHVKLLVIREDKTYVLDGEGNRKKDDYGNYVMRDLTDDEVNERANLISQIKTYIANIGTGEAAMGETMFENYLENHDEGDLDTHADGYYFHKNAAFTGVFSEAYPDVMEVIEDMSVGKFGYAKVDFGTIFVYKYAVSAADISKDSLSECFSDFYADMADSFFENQVLSFTPSVDFDKSFADIDIIGLPYNYIYLPVF